MTDIERKELLLKAKPILFNTEMIRAILDGRKTVTRRVVKPQPMVLNSLGIPPYKVGDIMYVRETWAEIESVLLNEWRYVYKADVKNERCFDEHFWKPSIHMPKEAARIFLRVTNVRVERLQDISDKDLIREGEMPYIHIDESFDRKSTQTSFLGTWNKMIKSKDIDCYGWDANPLVWVISFERIDEDE